MTAYLTPKGRILCAVVGCKNSSAKFAASQWYICSTHWPMVSKALRRTHRRLTALHNAAVEAKDWARCRRTHKAWAWNGRRIIAQANERAMGL